MFVFVLDGRPCSIHVSHEIKRIFLITILVCILICIILIIVLSYHMRHKTLKTTSPSMLIMVLVGAIISYCEVRNYSLHNLSIIQKINFCVCFV